MSRDNQEIEKEIRRIEGQLLVAKQICRENLIEINQLKKQQENNSILQQTHQLLSQPCLHSPEHVETFNKLLDLVYDEQLASLDTTVKSQNDNSSLILHKLSSNIVELERLFDYAKNLFTQPIQSLNMMNTTNSLQDLTIDNSMTIINDEPSIDTVDLQNRIQTMQIKLDSLHHYDDCSIQ